MTEREPGFYWLHIRWERIEWWSLGEWTGAEWFVIGREDPFPDAQFTEIGERVKRSADQ
jgi:hypothetical protein